MFLHPPFLLRKAAFVLWAGDTEHSAWCLAEDPFTSSWSPFAAFNLLDLWISHAKHQEGSFRWVTTVGEETQPRAPHLSTAAEGLHCLALQEKEYSLHRLTSTSNFSIQPTSALTIPVISTLEGQAVPDLPCWREVGRCCDTAAQCPGVTHQEVTCQTATKTPHCQGHSRPQLRDPDNGNSQMNPHRQWLSLLPQMAHPLSPASSSTWAKVT